MVKVNAMIPKSLSNYFDHCPFPGELCALSRHFTNDTIFITKFQLETPVEVLLRGGSCMWAHENSKMMTTEWSQQLIILDPENMTSGLNIGTPIKLHWRNMVVLGVLQTRILIIELGYDKWALGTRV